MFSRRLFHGKLLPLRISGGKHRLISKRVSEREANGSRPQKEVNVFVHIVNYALVAGALA